MLKKFLLTIFEDTRKKRFWVINNFLGAVIVASLISILLETDPLIYEKYGRILIILEYIFTAVFTLEYLTYIYLSHKKLSYLFSFYGIIDLLSILPAYIAFADLHYLQILRAVRLLRLFRLLRLLKIVRLAKYHRRKEITEWELLRLNLLVYFTAYVVLTAVFAIILFHIEQGVEGTHIKTIQDSIWSVMSALSSVGFGDTFPVSFPGRLFLGLVMMVGVGFLSFAILIMGRVVQLLLFGREIDKEFKTLGKPGKFFGKNYGALLKKEGERTID